MIIEHPTVRYRTNSPYPFHEEAAQVVQCDFCRRTAWMCGKDAGEAADKARKEGFKLVRGDKLSDPKKWSCGCHDTPNRK